MADGPVMTAAFELGAYHSDARCIVTIYLPNGTVDRRRLTREELMVGRWYPPLGGRVSVMWDRANEEP